MSFILRIYISGKVFGIHTEVISADYNCGVLIESLFFNPIDKSGGLSAGATFTTVAAKGVKIQEIGRLKPSNKPGNGYHGVKYRNFRNSVRSFELHSPHRSGPHQRWHWQRNTWNPNSNSITGRSRRWTFFGRRL